MNTRNYWRVSCRSNALSFDHSNIPHKMNSNSEISSFIYLLIPGEGYPCSFKLHEQSDMSLSYSEVYFAELAMQAH
jgi:hypothetical protein